MYSTCIHCHSPLGRNESFEHFPVGRRLAFDAAKGRLWVVCDSCGQWNLSPLEERWEAIEEGERSYRDARRRVTTEQIGLARLADGTQLIRIGAPQRPEFAAWRYGPRFAARHRRTALLLGGAVAAGAGFLIAGPVMGLLGIGAVVTPINLVSQATLLTAARRVAARFEDADGPMVITAYGMRSARLIALPSEPLGWGVRLKAQRLDASVGSFRATASADKQETITLTGDRAQQAARILLAGLNHAGGGRRVVDDAVGLLERATSAAEHLSRMATLNRDIIDLDKPQRLSLEMAAHEDLERRSLDGELSELEAAWRAADEVAAIADGLTLPARVLTSLERLGRRV